MAGFVDFDALKEKVRTRVGFDSFSANTKWDSIIADALERSINKIVSTMTGRGYTESQIRSWDRALELSAQLGLYWSLIDGGVGDNYDDKFINDLDCRTELETADVLISGKLVQPGGGGGVGGGIRSGTLKNDNDIFLPVDRRRGCW